MFILGLGCSTHGGKFGVDGVNRGVVDDAVDDTGITERSLMVLIVEEFLGEELLEFEPSARGVRRVVGFPVVAGLVHVWESKKMSKGCSDHSRIRDGLFGP